MKNIREKFLKTRKYNLRTLWFLSDKWFRILEFSLILGMFYYFKDKTQNIFVSVIYWLSWGIFYMWFLELGEILSNKINGGKKSSKIKNFIIWMFSMFLIMLIYFIITEAAKSIMLAK